MVGMNRVGGVVTGVHSCLLRCGHRFAGRPCGLQACEGWYGAREAEAGALPPRKSTGEEAGGARGLTPTDRKTTAK